MSKYSLAAAHSFASLVGWSRLFFSNRPFANELLRRRWQYFKSRTFVPPFETPEGFVIETPDALITFWCLFVERELHDGLWVDALRTAQSPLVVDVGANAGLFSHLAFTVNPKAEVVAFEPLPAMQDRLKKMKGRTGIHLTVHPKAVGRTPGEASLESPNGYDGISRICPGGGGSANVIRVPLTTLDAELAGRDVLLMKIDVEGFECEVLAGGPNVLSRTKFLIIEAHTIEHRDAITSALGAGWRRTRLGSSDYLFWR